MLFQNRKGKLNHPSLQATSEGCTTNRLFLKDQRNGMLYLINSGSALSVQPPNKEDIRNKSKETFLYAANSTKIQTYRVRLLKVDLGMCTKFQWPLIIADADNPIIGADFLKAYDSMIDLHRPPLVDGQTNLERHSFLQKGTIREQTRLHSSILQKICIFNN